jgi:DNA-binding FrmR family transcriptional regulator
MSPEEIILSRLEAAEGQVRALTPRSLQQDAHLHDDIAEDIRKARESLEKMEPFKR